jgi:peptidoglycan/LPS O-acetylase OafA/YrhL
MISERQAPDRGASQEPKWPRSMQNLTSLRIFAALWVVFLHFALGLTAGLPRPLHNFLAHGQNGVTLFFVLSGFILGHVYLPAFERQNFRSVAFWRARFARVYPVYALSLLVMLPFVLRQNPALLQNHLLPVLIPFQAFLLQSWDYKLLYAGNWNTPSWSLSCEGFFYLTFPITGLLVARLRPASTRLVLLSLLATSAAVHLAYWWLDPDNVGSAVPVVTINYWASEIFYNPVIRLLEFLFGLCLVKLYREIRTSGNSTKPWLERISPLAFAGLIALLFSFPHTPGLTIVTAPATLVLFGALIVSLASVPPGRFNAWFACPIMLLLGEASYGMYMLQRPLETILDAAAAKLGLAPVSESWIAFAVFLVSLATLSVVSFKWFETPVRRMIRNVRRFSVTPGAIKA